MMIVVGVYMTVGELIAVEVKVLMIVVAVRAIAVACVANRYV
jgi:hypothetical protein